MQVRIADQIVERDRGAVLHANPQELLEMLVRCAGDLDRHARASPLWNERHRSHRTERVEHQPFAGHDLAIDAAERYVGMSAAEKGERAADSQVDVALLERLAARIPPQREMLGLGPG